MMDSVTPPSLRELDLLEGILTGGFMQDAPVVTPGYKAIVAAILQDIYRVSAEPAPEALGYNANIREHGLDWPSHAMTMVGRKRLRNFRALIENVIAEGIAGDIVETGVWRGGASIMARAVLAAYDEPVRCVYLADSFAGLPPPDAARFPADAGSDLHEFRELAISLDQVRQNFATFGLLDERVRFVQGWFRDTMPDFPARQIAVLRLDGDMYESTIDPLTHLFDRVPAGGWVIVDDYHMVEACRLAVQDFLAARGLAPVLQEIDGSGVYFRK